MANIILTPSQIWEYSGAGDVTTPDYHKQYGHYLAMDNTLKPCTFLALDAPLAVASCNITGFNTTDFQGQQIPLWRLPEPYVDGQYDLQYDATGTTFYSHLKMHFGNITHFKILILYRLNNYWHGLDMTTKYLISEPVSTWDGYSTIGDIVSDTIPIPTQNTSPTQGGYVTDNAGSIWAAIAGHEINNETPKELYVADALFRPSVPWDNPRELYYGILIEINDDFEFIGYDEIPVTPPAPDEPDFGDDTVPAGGMGEFSAPSDSYTIADLATSITARRTALNDAFNNGGVKIYQIAGQYMGDVMGTIYGGDFFQRFENFMFNPLSSVLACHMIPANLRGAQIGSTDHDLTAGGFNISSHMQTPTQFPHIDSLGEFELTTEFDFPHFYDGFPDFAPYTKAILHLPFIGEIELDVNAFMYGKLKIKYICDNTNGNVAAWVFCVDRNGIEFPHYVATGNCAVSIPLFASSQNGSAVGKIGSGIASFAGGLMLSNPAAMLGGLATTAGGFVDAATTSRQTASTGGDGGNLAQITNTVCWLEIIRAIWVNPETFDTLAGIPSNVSGKLTDFRGFVSVSDIDLIDCAATEAEIAEIEMLLKDGIFYNPAEPEPEPNT